MKRKPARPGFLRQTSAGGVVFKKSGLSVSVCLVGRIRERSGQRADQRVVWCLPKGHVEEGERFEEAALREAREESGLVGTLLRPLGAVSYQFLDGGTKNRILKTVHFFLIRYEHGNLEDHDEEVACAEWFPIEKAFECAEYGGEREVLRKAADEIKRFT